MKHVLMVKNIASWRSRGGLQTSRLVQVCAGNDVVEGGLLDQMDTWAPADAQ